MYPKYHPLIVAEFAAADDYKVCMYVCMYTHICRYEYIHTYPEGMRAALQVSLFFRVFLHQVVLVFLVLTRVCVCVRACVCTGLGFFCADGNARGAYVCTFRQAHAH